MSTKVEVNSDLKDINDLASSKSLKPDKISARNNKMFITAPASSRSGYGAHARDLIWSFIQLGKFDVNIVDVPWGNTPRDYFSGEMTKKDKEIHKRMLLEGTRIDYLPDYYVDIRIPNEFELRGKVNIGITAGIETNVVSQNWIEKTNKMNLTIVPSKHSKDGFINTTYDKLQQQPDGKQVKIGELKSIDTGLHGQIETLFEGADEDIYKPLSPKEIDSEFFDWLNDEVPEKFAFLFVGLWGQGGFGEDRKDVGTLIKTFYESFANKKKQPALVLKTSGASPSIMDKYEIRDKISHIKALFPKDWKLPNVYVLHGNLTDVEMNYLYNHPKIKAMVSFTHGEGYGRPLLEASMVGLPVMCSAWSGQLDFLDKDLSLLLPGELVDVPQSQHWKDIIVPESKWYKVSTESAYKGFNMLFEDYDLHKKNAKILMDRNRKQFTLNNMTEQLDIMIKHVISSLDNPNEASNHMGMMKPVGLNLPKMKNVEESENATV